MKLGKLEKLDPKTYWKKEASEFTPWLAQAENIQLLSESIGTELEVEGTEQSVGPFSADILCRDALTGHYVLIENQLEKTDHTHLGQIMTYAAGLDAVTIIWIAKNFTDEHRAALDWLNRITNDTFNFFGIEIELYKIGNSDIAPHFKIVSKPNDWSKQVKVRKDDGGITETKKLQLQYWAALGEYMSGNSKIIKMRNARAQHWTDVALGKTDFYLSAVVNSRENVLAVWLNIVGVNAKQNFDKLYEIAYTDSLEKIGKDLIWERLDGKKMSYVFLRTQGDFTNESDWPAQFEWFKENLEKFYKFFKPLLVKF
ncbi:MAG: DUF4268 domain-containing protein [Ignavibacteriaceae bacterium]|nr:DUF4268 domain-containing protein [Ignavibacteriaceae bacterium]